MSTKIGKASCNYLFPSLAGSENKQSLVGLPGSLALSMEPSGSTSFLSRLKSCCPGLSLHDMEIDMRNTHSQG